MTVLHWCVLLNIFLLFKKEWKELQHKREHWKCLKNFHTNVRIINRSTNFSIAHYTLIKWFQWWVKRANRIFIHIYLYTHTHLAIDSFQNKLAIFVQCAVILKFNSKICVCVLICTIFVVYVSLSLPLNWLIVFIRCV